MFDVHFPKELVTIIKYVNWKQQQQHIIRPQNFLASKLFSAPSVSIVSTTNKKSYASSPLWGKSITKMAIADTE